MESIFSVGGLIARAHPEYEFRPGQIEMANAVLGAFEQARHLIVEAGTGTGKTLAYLIPAIAAATSGRGRIVISTGTKNLQEQLMKKDIPFLQRALPVEFSAAYMKGRGNYVCLHRIRKVESAPILRGLEDVDMFEQVRKWSFRSETGDRAELVDLPDDLPFWRKLDARSEICLGQKCEDFDPCFITRMRQRALDADIVIVNHHLFFADLALRGGDYGRVLPDYAAVIFDEAHLIEDVAAEYFGRQVSSNQLEELLRETSMLQIEDGQHAGDLVKASSRLSRSASQFWAGFRHPVQEGRYPIQLSHEDGSPLPPRLKDARFTKLESALDRVDALLDLQTDEDLETQNLLRRIRQFHADLRFIIAGDNEGFVYWLEKRTRSVALRACPIDVSSLLRQELFDRVETVVLTSATLASANSFDFVRQRLGVFDADELMASSNFDFRSQALLYLPKGMPDPRSLKWADAAADQVLRILRATSGRAFVLSTSFAGMRALYERVSESVGYPCLLQGTASKTGLLEAFRNTPNSVLFATSSFWQGVDVRGEQLSCVIIEKLPFAVPSDPIVAARQRFIDERGGSSFYEYSVPQAIITLKQGLGRLIRATTDRGVLAILDPRITTKPYGRLFRESLPPCRITRNVEELTEVFGGS